MCIKADSLLVETNLKPFTAVTLQIARTCGSAVKKRTQQRLFGTFAGIPLRLVLWELHAHHQSPAFVSQQTLNKNNTTPY